MKRPKHKAPVLFGERMRLAYSDVSGGAHWIRVYGDVAAQLDYAPLRDEARRYRYRFVHREGFADTVKAAVRLLESLIRRTGRALPAAALVSRKEWRATNG